MIDKSERLNRFIANLLDMTKLESGAIVPNTAPHDVGEIVGSALRRAGKILARHKVSLELAADLPMLTLDAVLFEQVLFNICWTTPRNMRPRRPRYRSGAGGRDSVCLQIIDEGEGIPPGRAGEHVRQVLSRAKGRPCPPRHRPRPCDFTRLCRGDARHGFRPRTGPTAAAPC